MSILIPIIITILVVFFCTQIKVPLSYKEGTPDHKKIFRNVYGQVTTIKKIQSGKHPGGQLRLAVDVTILEWILLKLHILN